MGTWGNDISDNDQYSDLKIEFFELYNKAVPVDVISESIIKEHNENFDSDEDSNNFQFALADFQWQCKALDDRVLEKIKSVVKSKSYLLLWQELDASQEDLAAREKNLDEFLTKISSSKKNAKS